MVVRVRRDTEPSSLVLKQEVVAFTVVHPQGGRLAFVQAVVATAPGLDPGVSSPRSAPVVVIIIVIKRVEGFVDNALCGVLNEVCVLLNNVFYLPIAASGL